MLLGIVSDIHDHREHAAAAAEALRERGIAKLLLLGDYCSPAGVRAFLSLKGLPGIGILGNNDGDILELQEAFEILGWTLAGPFHACEEEGWRIAAYHGTVPQLTDALVSCGSYDVVLCGHTHDAVIREEGRTLFVNPGTVHGSGKRATCAVLDTAKRKAELIEL